MTVVDVPSRDWPGGCRQGGGDLSAAALPPAERAVAAQSHPAWCEDVPDLRPRLQQCQGAAFRAVGPLTASAVGYTWPCPTCSGPAVWVPSGERLDMSQTVYDIRCRTCPTSERGQESA